MEQFVVSARKYRPQTFTTVIGQSSITSTLKNAISRNHLAHAYLFCGPRGVGKTTCARIFAKTINCLNPSSETEACDTCESCQSFNEGRSYSIHELDAASNNSVDDIRSLIDQVRVPPQIGQYSVYIIDEVHMLSAAAFNAFLKTLEEPPAHAIFILATTEKHKILPTILSRCQIYDFNRIRVEDTVEYLKYIANNEQVKAEDAALHIIAQKADGAMRDALSIFDQVVSFSGNELTYAKVIENLNVLDYDYYFRLTNAFLAGDYTTALLIFNDILSRGFEAQHFIAGLCTHFRDLLVCKDPQTVVLLEASESIKRQYVEQAAACDASFLFEALNLANRCDVGYKSSGNPRLHVELCMLQISNILNEKKNSDSEIEEGEKGSSSTPTTGNTPPPASTTNAPSAGTNVDSTSPVQEKPRPQQPIAPSISIKDALKGKVETAKVDEEDNNVAEPEPEYLGSETFSQEKLQEVWNKFALDLDKSKIRLSNAMQQAQPVLGDNFSITSETNNDLYFKALKEAEKEISSYLKKTFNNGTIVITFKMQTVESKTWKPYSNTEKFKYMADKNPNLLKLKNELGLDFD